jgi:anti-anti-sigma regulatory factor/PAS domain-containing protein
MDLSAIPAWVIDVEHMRIVWANDLAAQLWRASSREDLLARDLSGAPESVKLRTQVLMSRACRGEVFTEEWTLYPKGVPTPVKLHLSGTPLDDGRIGLLNQALPSEAAASPDLLRGIEALRHVPIIVALVDAKGMILMQNPAALRAFGESAVWAGWFSDPTDARTILTQALSGASVKRSLLFDTLDGERLHVVEAHRTKDPISGAAAVLVHHTDETEREAAQRAVGEQRERSEELEATLAVVEKQRNDILALSAPILDVGDATIAMPIIGHVDEARSREIVDQLLPQVVARQAATVILDLTNAVVADEGGAASLVALLSAIRLLGAQPMVTGVQPAFATQLASLGFDTSRVKIARSLATALSGRRPRRADD